MTGTRNAQRQGAAILKKLVLVATHFAALGIGFALGIYALPILIAPPAPVQSEVQAKSFSARYRGQFRRDLKDSDALHWGEGEVYVGHKHIVFEGKIAPGPDYKLYLSPQFVETEVDFVRLKASMARVGDVKTFKNFIVAIPEGIDAANYSAVVVWCETFGQFITAAKYR